MLEGLPGDGRIWPLSLLSGLCLQIEKPRLCSLDQPFGGTFQRGKNIVFYGSENILFSENIPLSSSELSSTKAPGSKRNQALTHCINHGLWTQQLNRSRQISQLPKALETLDFHFLMQDSSTYKTLAHHISRLVLGSYHKVFGGSKTWAEDRGEQNNICLQWFAFVSWKTLQCKITGGNTAQHAETQGYSLYHCDINFPHIQQFSVCLRKPEVHPD